MSEFSRSSELSVPPAVVLADLTLAEVNAELAPLLRMTAPENWSTRPVHSWPTGQTLFNSWILLFGFIPLDRHSFRLAKADRESGFDESSMSLINSEWQHRREIVAIAGGCRVTDRVAFKTRIPGLGYLLEPVYALVVSHRHRRLRERYRQRSG